MVLPLWGQNLISNGGFEDTIKCPIKRNQLYLADNWKSASGTPDLYHGCSSNPYITYPNPVHKNVVPKNGQGIAAFGFEVYSNRIMEYEYIKYKLPNALIAGHQYCMTFWFLTSDTNKYAVDKLGVLMTEENISQANGKIERIPQFETLSSEMLNNKIWKNFKFIYESVGFEKYVIFGQFNDLIELKIDTVNVNGSIAVWWFFDDISLFDCTPELVLEIPNVFTPNGDGDNDVFTATIENAATAQIYIYNRLGSLVFSSQDLNFSWNGRYNGQDLAEGVYFVVIQAVGLNDENAVEKQAVHLFR